MERIVILTGAGISAESGIATFRDKDGLWTKVNLEDVATPDAFRRDPQYVHGFHNDLRRGLAGYEPNDAHRALARLEQEFAGAVLVVTQNVDDLHERAGSRNLIHMHGELYKSRCQNCSAVRHWIEDLTVETVCPDCGMPAGMRPHVTWFYEMPMQMERIYADLDRCDLFLSIGTSGNVYPAAGFVEEVRRMGRARAVELNLEPSEGTMLFDEAIHGPATRVVPDYVDLLLAGS